MIDDKQIVMGIADSLIRINRQLSHARDLGITVEISNYDIMTDRLGEFKILSDWKDLV